MQAAVAQYELLKKEFASNNLDKCKDILGNLKLQLVQLSYLSSSDQNILLLTREILEFAVKWSVKAKNISAFEGYFSQLKQFYVDYSHLPTSQRMYSLYGLNLLRLLAQSKIAQFHTELEALPVDIILKNIYIKHPVQVEQCLMEGSYNKIWIAKSNVPAEEYLFFMEMLVHTIRKEIAECCVKAYDSIPVSDAITLLYFKTPQEFSVFCEQVNWVIKNQYIYFKNNLDSELKLPAHKIISHSLEYAKELERIV